HEFHQFYEFSMGQHQHRPPINQSPVSRLQPPVSNPQSPHAPHPNPGYNSAKTEKKSMPHIPQRANVVVIGGGVMGASTAYHLGLKDEKDVVLLERQPFFGLGAT